MLVAVKHEEQEIGLADGRRLGFAEYGAGDGPVVMFFHGWPSSRYQGAYLDGKAAALGLRIVSPDRPGVGRSSPRPRNGFAEWADDVAELADALGIRRFSLFAVSGGGPYALATSLRLGERIRRTAVVCGAPPLGDGVDREHLHWAYRTLAGMRRLRHWVFPGVYKMSEWMLDRGVDQPPMSWMLKSIPEVDRRAIESVDGWDMVVRSYREAFRGGPDGPLADGELYLGDWDFDPGEIRVPVRFWHGTADANLPCEVAKKLAARVPGAEGTWVEGEGHYSLPVRYSGEVLAWLNQAGSD